MPHAIPPLPFRPWRAAAAGFLLLTASLGAAEPGTVELTLDRARSMAFYHNLSLRAQREAMVAAGYLGKAEWGVFEPELVLSAERVSNERENTIEQRISQGTAYFSERNDLYGAGLEGVVPTGARYRIGYTARDLSNNLRVLSADPLRKEWQSFLGVSVTQPLLKDFGLSASLARVRLARGDEAIAIEDYRRQALLVVAAVESAYWELYIAQERERLRTASVASAEELLSANRERVREGKMSEIELIEAESGLALRRSWLSEARQQRFEAVARLRTLVAEPVQATAWELRAAEVPGAPAPVPAIEAIVADAWALHPEYLSKQRALEQEDVRVAYARNQAWPQVDLKASYGLNGLGPDQASAWFDLEERRYDSWSVGVEVRLPIGTGIRQRNELRAAEARKRGALLELKAAEVELANTILGTHRRVENLASVAGDFAAVAASSRRLLDSELARLDEGKSESRRVLEVESKLADAQIAELESRGDLARARIELDLASGRLLRERGLDLALVGGSKGAR